jgi:hypothetical protein
MIALRKFLPMPKIPLCNSCQFYSNAIYFTCAIHPDGVAGNYCLDYRRNLEYIEPEQWVPQGYTYYNGELIKLPENKPSQELQLWLLDHHPCFTGHCPECGYEFTERLPEYWDCPNCGWLDEWA